MRVLLGLGFLDLAGGHLLARVRLGSVLDNGGTHPVNGAPDQAGHLGLREPDLARDVDLAAVLVVAQLEDPPLALGEHAHAGLQQRALVGEVVGRGGSVLGLELDHGRPRLQRLGDLLLGGADRLRELGGRGQAALAGPDLDLCAADARRPARAPAAGVRTSCVRSRR